jgi:zinc and cadmium transporter
VSVFAWVLSFSILGGILSMAAAVVYAVLPIKTHVATVRHLVSVATGALLGAAFVGLLPEALESRPDVGARGVMATALLGMLIFFLLEKTLIWRHAHHEGAHAHAAKQSAAYLIVIGDTFHNFLDGVLIAVAFTTDVKLGIITSLAIIAHELPQELGDLVIMLNSGFSRHKALTYNAVSGLATVVGALLALTATRLIHDSLPYLLAFTASSFIYVAVADLIPSLHRHSSATDSITQIVLIIAGMLLIVVLDQYVH